MRILFYHKNNLTVSFALMIITEKGRLKVSVEPIAKISSHFLQNTKGRAMTHCVSFILLLCNQLKPHDGNVNLNDIYCYLQISTV